MATLDSRISYKMPFRSNPHASIFIAAYMGSHSHGTYIPSTEDGGVDDVDIMGGIIPPVDYLLGLKKFEHWVEFIDELDCTFYDIRKLVRLWLQSNPNVIGLLWLKDEHYLTRSRQFDAFVNIRSEFASKAAYNPFRGYGRSQLNQMDRGVYQGYMGTKRKMLVDQFGYDIKHAAHLIRLLRMGTEYLATGTLNVDRTGIDADELKEIKQGKWSRARILTVADEGFDALDEAYHTSPLPEKPNESLVESVLVDILTDTVNEYIEERQGVR